MGCMGWGWSLYFGDHYSCTCIHIKCGKDMTKLKESKFKPKTKKKRCKAKANTRGCVGLNRARNVYGVAEPGRCLYRT